MWPYWLIFFLSAWYALNERANIDSTQKVHSAWGNQWWSAFILLSLAIGLRDRVGADWWHYLSDIDTNASTTWSEFLQHSKYEVGYSLLSWLGSQWGGIYFVDTVCAFFFTWGLFSFCKIQPRPWLALLVAVPYLIVVVAMGYTRQAVAIGLFMLGLVALHRNKIWLFFLFVIFAALFHKSALIMTPIALFSKSKHRWLTLMGVGCILVVLYLLSLDKSMNTLIQNYNDSQMTSAGAGVRVAMNAFPAMIFLFYRKRFIHLSPEQCNFWTWMAFAAFGCVVLLNFFQRSTAIDRTALYLIPLQIMVWSNIPDVLSRSTKRSEILVLWVIFYCAIVLFVWLFFGVYSRYWLPYRFYPWEALWQ